MIGIDVVDLKDPLLKPRNRSHLRFINHRNEHLGKFPKKITDNEIYWIYWAAKEAVFKFYRMEETFDPKQIEIQILSVSFGQEIQVKYKSEHTDGNIWLNHSCIVAIAHGPEAKNVVWQLFDISKAQGTDSEILRSLASRYLYNHHLLNTQFIGEGIPSLLETRSEQTLPVSLSHHNRYGAFATLIPPSLALKGVKIPEKHLHGFSDL